MELIKGRTYTRKEIREMLGGSDREYLPQKDGKVVAGCFRKDLNPDAPWKILPGNGPRIMKSAEVFANQSDAVPVFIKLAVNEWKYVGDFKCVERSFDPKEIELNALRTGRNDISQILYLKEALT